MNITELTQFINEHPDNYSIQLKRHHKILYANIDTKYNFSTFGEKLYHYLNGDNVGKCNVCGNICKFDGFHKGYRSRCSYKCMGESKVRTSHEERICVICDKTFVIYKIREKTTCSNECLLKLNASVDVNLRRQETLKQTMLEKYGIEHPSKLSTFSTKLKQTKLAKYGDENYVNVEKCKKTKLERYGNENYTNSDKRKATCIDKFGVDNFSKTSEFKAIHFRRVIGKFKEIIPLFDIATYSGVGDQKYKFKCTKCDNVFESSINNGNIPLCRICHPIDREQEQHRVLEYIRSILPQDTAICSSDRGIIPPMELDIYIPSKKIAIEYDGIYWHGEICGNKDKNYHLNKTDRCALEGIQLIHIFEIDWLYKQDIVKSRLKHILNCVNVDKSIYARNCVIKTITNVDTIDFLNTHHIQGHSNSTVQIGAFYNNELVSVMTFGNLRSVLGSKNIDKTDYEMYRFCVGNKNVVGIAGKMLKYFIKLCNPSKIISYADRRYSNDSAFYNKIGFKLVSKTPANYWYFSLTNTKKLYYRFGFRKDQLSKKLTNFDPNLSEWQNMQLNGYDRIWDCGHLKFVWIKS